MNDAKIACAIFSIMAIFLMLIAIYVGFSHKWWYKPKFKIVTITDTCYYSPFKDILDEDGNVRYSVDRDSHTHSFLHIMVDGREYSVEIKEKVKQGVHR